MKLAFFLLSFGCLFLACDSDSASEANSPESNETIIESPQIDSNINLDTTSVPLYTVEPFEKGENDWGYRIMAGDAVFINQPHIPAAQGNLGFSSKEKATIAGEFMMYKLNTGISPPTVSIEELDSLGVL